MAKKRKQTIYRDRKTGRFVSKQTWKRSRAHNGSRFKREKLVPPRGKRQLTPGKPERPRTVPRRPEKPSQIYEWLVTFTYNLSRKSLDVIATATEEDEAIDKAIEFLSDDPKGQYVVRNLDSFAIRAARGRRVKRHKATRYRRESRA